MQTDATPPYKSKRPRYERKRQNAEREKTLEAAKRWVGGPRSENPEREAARTRCASLFDELDRVEVDEREALALAERARADFRRAVTCARKLRKKNEEIVKGVVACAIQSRLARTDLTEEEREATLTELDVAETSKNA
jgi:hypothetical protein